MRTKTLAILLATLAMTVSARTLWAARWEGTVKLGGIYVDEQGDLSTVQETYNIYDGFSLSQLRLAGSPTPRTYLMLNLRDINLDSRKGEFLYRDQSMLKLTGSFDQHRQVFDPDRSIDSNRNDWNFGARVTPTRWLSFSGGYSQLMREGDRLSFPVGTVSVLGTSYDNTLRSGSVGVEARHEGRGVAVDYQFSNFQDHLASVADRSGQVASARMFGRDLFYDKLTHLLRAAVGKSELSNGDLDYTLASFQYTGVVRPVRQFQFKYNFGAQRIDNESTRLKTDRIQNNLDATFFHPWGSVNGGYGYETNDDDRRLTSYHSWRAGATLRYDRYNARFQYAGRVKQDDEDLTLLKDVEASRFLADLEVKPVTGLALSGGLNIRQREFPDINVKAEGEIYRAGAKYTCPGWGSLSGTYAYANDEYTDRAAGYEANSNTVTARVDLERIHNLRLSSGLIYLDAGKDVDIEKSILFFEGMYTVRKDLHFEVKYNVYNYDDYILLDRYYTANVVWFNVAYDLHLE